MSPAHSRSESQGHSRAREPEFCSLVHVRGEIRNLSRNPYYIGTGLGIDCTKAAEICLYGFQAGDSR